MNWNEDDWHRGIVEYPNYMVKSDKVAIPFYDIDYALAWQKKVYEDTGVITQVFDLTAYDWKLNPGNIKFHNLSKEG